MEALWLEGGDLTRRALRKLGQGRHRRSVRLVVQRGSMRDASSGCFSFLRETMSKVIS